MNQDPSVSPCLPPVLTGFWDGRLGEVKSCSQVEVGMEQPLSCGPLDIPAPPWSPCTSTKTESQALPLTCCGCILVLWLVSSVDDLRSESFCLQFRECVNK